MSAHTPGPWFVDRRRDGDSNAIDILAANPEWLRVAAIISDEKEPTEAEHADARLIAAAPDLLAALRLFANIGEYRELCEAMSQCLRVHERAGFLKSFDTAKAVVAKAEGRS